MATLDLRSEFPPVSTETWEQAIREDLKGADYANKLIWQTPEGIDVKPYYRAEDLLGLNFLTAAPGDFPYVRGADSATGWRIREEIEAADPEEANSAARAAVAAGAEEIAFCSATLGNSSDLSVLLANLGEIPIHFENPDQATIRLLVDRLKKRNHGASVSAGFDWTSDLDFCAQLIANAPPALSPFMVHAEEFQNRGASAIEEVGFALAAGVDLVAAIEERSLSAERVADAIIFSFAMGPDFFLQVAKLRAFRMAWAQAMESFGVKQNHARARIYARTSRWNRTVYDPHVNMLRGTTEAISAAWAGAESIYIAPFDECFKRPDEVSRRLARNTQLILKQEALLSRIADPAGGSYLIEALTDSIARKAWALLQETESMGGYRAAAGFISRTLEQHAAAQEKAVASRRRVLTGVNRFANASERALDRIDGARVSESRRASQPFEQLRLRTERHALETGKTPRVLLAEIGDVKMRSARSGFAADFFACAGFEVDTQRFATASEIAQASADLIVLCSSDPEYLRIASELMPVLASRGINTPVLIAGNPESSDELRSAGVAGFVHLRTHVIELLTKLQQQLGIRD